MCAELQLLDMFDQHGEVLQELAVLLQELLSSNLSLCPRPRLQTQLLLEQGSLTMTNSKKKKTPKNQKNKTKQ